MRLWVLLAGLFAEATFAQEIEPARRIFEERAVRLTWTPVRDCSPILGDRCDRVGSAVILTSTESMALLATAEHVLPAAGENDLATISLVWRKPPGHCLPNLQPASLWRPVAPVGPRDDIAFIAAKVSCSVPLEPVPNAWADGAPSFGLTVHFLAGTPLDLSAPITLSSTCIRAISCFDGGVVHLQDRSLGGVSGSAVFSTDGIAGIASTSTHLVATPQMFEWLATCATGDCRRSGDDVDLQLWLKALQSSTATR
ncbi:hypothetical protein DXV76_19940 [Rhodobacteraceae bacterium CCMM004]|nr:hypothetical protein DXV76_19940 [Rhodobacteraceae bacterium CCMM004]